ncbi:DsbA family protein [Alkalilimnicola sp. S0819]|uniref:DsbA family oxidoreductase n=1 Tax=Alkalilimnicola sp. S0819 TaxID=2613922 RepID=UPI0012616602|nr:DsbA family protein [Alkalilimnicola sp. S0819]KAB7627501.1 DsbA family protein [Alkalilimnicola sp. S0819]MPQ15655.1 thioredoxin domain-containing protein [Alkalilimnicola sp. S0819]
MSSAHSEPTTVSFFFDYICPFCYVGSHRLQRLGSDWPLAVEWRFLEIHPDNPAGGRPLEELGYSAEQWQRMNQQLDTLLAEEGLPSAPRSFTTNSRRALLMAQAVLEQRPTQFLALHNALFHAYFVEQRNIGDPEVLMSIAREHGVEDLAEQAWSGPEYLQKLLRHVEGAQALQLSGVPTLVVAGRSFPGVVSVDTLAAALQREHGGG